MVVFNSLYPNDAIWWCRTGSTLAQVMACCLMAPRDYLNQCIKPIVSSQVLCDIQLRAISNKLFMNSIRDNCSEIILSNITTASPRGQCNKAINISSWNQVSRRGCKRQICVTGLGHHFSRKWLVTCFFSIKPLTHWGRVTHIYSDNLKHHCFR